MTTNTCVDFLEDFEDDFVELDEDTQLANFRSWLTTMAPAGCDTVADRIGVMERDFAIYEPNPHHDSFGITWSSPSEDVTRCANLAMDHLIRHWGSLPEQVKDTHPNFCGWFHQGGAFDASGWQFWEWIGHNKELAYFVCELLVEWLPAKTAQFLAQGR